MTIFFTSDTHFGHARIIELSNRPFRDVKHMNEELVRRWNDVVGPEDKVFHMGDVALGAFEDSMSYVAQLNGYKVLVEGNHDRTFIDPDSKRLEKAERYAERFRKAYTDVFDEVIEGDVDHAAEHLLIPYLGVNLKAGKSKASQVLRMSHFPYTGDSHDKPRYDRIRPKDDGKTLLHGHTHQSHVLTKSAKGTTQIHVGVDSWDYAPVSLDTLMVRYGTVDA